MCENVEELAQASVEGKAETGMMVENRLALLA